MKPTNHTCNACGRMLPGHRKPKAKTCGRGICQLIHRSTINQARKESALMPVQAGGQVKFRPRST